MTNYVGIDLGTTNSVVCSYDGKSPVRVWKSPEQNDVTPSAIYISQRDGSEVKYVGKRAYDLAPQNPMNVATLFKRDMGTNRIFSFGTSGTEWTPEQCSAEILKALFGYLREEIRDDPNTGTVVTVPDAFDQRRKDATSNAAELAGLGKVALIQEPIAAVMSVMRGREADGLFLIFDLGGGTLDITVAENVGKKVSLLGNGGIGRCGGRDFDRAVRDSIVRPWLLENFDLPEDFHDTEQFIRLDRLATWATEKAKIALSSANESVISLSEAETQLTDRSEREVYVDIPFDRDTLNELISDKINDAVEAANDTLRRVNIGSDRVTEIVFIGGPTQYKPLRDTVSEQLRIPVGQHVNPMTAVAEGASLYAESCDWDAVHSPKKETMGQLNSGTDLGISFKYEARVANDHTALTVRSAKPLPSRMEIQVDDLDTGWTSGRRPLESDTTIELSLGQLGSHAFEVKVLDATGRPIVLDESLVTITRVEVLVDSIRASRSIAVEVFDQAEDKSMPHYLLRPGDKLPKGGTETFLTTEELNADHLTGTIRVKLWEGDIEDPISDNLFVGFLRITGLDLESGVVPEGSELEVRYEILESGKIVFDAQFPNSELTFEPDTNIYIRQGAQIDYATAAPGVAVEGQQLLKRITSITDAVDDPRLEQAHSKAARAAGLSPTESDPEVVADADDNIHEAKKILAVVRAENLPQIRQMELAFVTECFETRAAQYAKAAERSAFSAIIASAQESIANKGSAFEQYTDKLWKVYFRVMERQDWHIIDWYERLVGKPHKFHNYDRFLQLKKKGDRYVQEEKIEKLRKTIDKLYSIYIYDGDSEEEMAQNPNIAVGKSNDDGQ